MNAPKAYPKSLLVVVKASKSVKRHQCKIQSPRSKVGLTTVSEEWDNAQVIDTTIAKHPLVLQNPGLIKAVGCERHTQIGHDPSCRVMLYISTCVSPGGPLQLPLTN
jgi:hypothetical protein